MDASRDADFSNLHRIFNDPMQPQWKRRQAFQGYQKLQEQVKDRKLSGLRLRLIKALRADDTKAVSKIERQINEYSWRMGWNRH